MTDVFDAYARYYNLLYRDKNYIGEAEYIAYYIRKNAPNASTILELGCGTGNHAEYLVRNGYEVHGIDISRNMLEYAKTRKSTLSQELGKRLSFEHGDVRYLRTEKKYDVVISLFHVVSYQVTNEDLSAIFETAAKHLKPGGVFLFDFWYGPAVLKQQPEIRIKRLFDEDVKITRIAEPINKVNENIVDVNYNIFVEQRESGNISQFHEKHKMRYLFLPELSNYMQSENWKKFSAYKWMSDDRPDENTWSAFVVAVRK